MMQICSEADAYEFLGVKPSSTVFEIYASFASKAEFLYTKWKPIQKSAAHIDDLVKMKLLLQEGLGISEDVMRDIINNIPVAQNDDLGEYALDGAQKARQMLARCEDMLFNPLESALERALPAARYSAYDYLGVNSTAQDDQIKNAYKGLAFKYNVDHTGNPFIQKIADLVRTAYVSVRDADSRKKYNARLSRGRNSELDAVMKARRAAHEKKENQRAKKALDEKVEFQWPYGRR